MYISNEIFKILVVTFLIASIVMAYTIRYFLKKRGIDIDSSRNMLKLILWVCPILFIPFWLVPSGSIGSKIAVTIIGILAVVVNYFIVDRGGQFLRQLLGIEDEEDKLEREKRESRKKHHNEE